MAAPETVPGPKGSRLAWGKSMAADALGYMGTLQKEYGDIVKVPWLLPTYQVSDPDLIGKILLGTEKTNRKSYVYRRLNPLLGSGLVTSNGDFWKKQRRLSTPAFHAKVLSGLLPMMESEAEAMVESWAARPGDQLLVDVSQELTKLTLKIIVRALFSFDLQEKSQIISDAVHEMQEYANYLFYEILPLPLFVPNARNRRAKRALRDLDAVVYSIIDDHRQKGEFYRDLLSVYISARDEETGEGMSDRQLRDEVVTLMLAGHDTTASTLSMSLDLISRHPEVQTRLMDEIRGLPQGAWQPDDLKNLVYTSAVFSESLRLYPATWAIARELTEDLAYKDYVFPKGSSMLLAQWLTHRHPDYWEDAEQFKPERFTRELKQHPFAFFPFGGGPRTCIGSQLSRLEAQIILPTILRKFQIAPVPGHQFQLRPRITLTFDPGVKLLLTPRKK